MTTAPDLFARASRGLVCVSDLPDDTEGARYELIDGSLLVSPTKSLRHQYVAGRLFRLLADSVGSDLVAGETLATELHTGPAPDDAFRQQAMIDGRPVTVGIRSAPG